MLLVFENMKSATTKKNYRNVFTRFIQKKNSDFWATIDSSDPTPTSKRPQSNFKIYSQTQYMCLHFTFYDDFPRPQSMELYKSSTCIMNLSTTFLFKIYYHQIDKIARRSDIQFRRVYTFLLKSAIVLVFRITLILE